MGDSRLLSLWLPSLIFAVPKVDIYCNDLNRDAATIAAKESSGSTSPATGHLLVPWLARSRAELRHRLPWSIMGAAASCLQRHRMADNQIPHFLAAADELADTK